ncbi:MAG TPA: NADH-quinone oxidoreductase subunit G [Thermopetrobacter sp.]|nr:NADH-quinone oxidoreductase subunit G [Thermopetrobacter sp.]
MPVKLKIDGELIEVEDGATLLQACEQAGKEIPRFCYHERLSIAGNCRMCLVEVKGIPKPMASCALSVNDLRPGPDGEPPEVFTESDVTKKARRGVMEFLLINHPLDCPICDQGGECDLQDQAMGYGLGVSRFAENKRAVEDRFISPLIRTIMTRCIKCTRCVRFIADVAGIGDLGATGRGEDVEITTWLDAATQTELAGNIVDLCPVGALTSATYAFRARPWELDKTPTIDVMDAMGCHIRVDAKFGEILRILPRECDAINEEWISDKSRHSFDGIQKNRLDTPWVRDENGQLRAASWEEAFGRIREAFPKDDPTRAAAIAGDLAAAEEAFALKALMEALGVPHVDGRPPHVPLGAAGGRAGWLFNPTIAGIDEADAILLIGANPRHEAAVLNTRIHRAFFERGALIALIGQPCDLPYEYRHLGETPDVLLDMADGKGAFLNVLKRAERPLIILGMGALMRPGGKTIHAAAARLAQAVGAVTDEWNGFGVLHTAAGLVGALEAGCLPGRGGRDTAGILRAAGRGDIGFVWLLGADDIDMSALGDAFVVYQGSHGDAGAHRADVILPGAAFTEKEVTFVNMEGRAQMTRLVTPPPGEAREDWAILRAAADHLGAELPFDSLDALRAKLYEKAPHLARLGAVAPADPAGIAELAALTPGRVSNRPLASPVADFWLTNPIARASRIMREMSRLSEPQGREAAE